MNMRKICAFIVSICFCTNMLAPSSVLAQNISSAPALQLIGLTAAYQPVQVQGLNIDPQDPFKFEFIVDKGPVKSLHDHGVNEFEQEANQLIKYFLASLSVPEDQMWVNLSPYEKNRIIPQVFGQTEMGRDLLAQDYMLKQLVSSLMYPDGEFGQKFWDEIYGKLYKNGKQQGSSLDLAVETFNKVWIVPGTVKIYEHKKGAFITEAKLKVMLDEDYLALDMNKNSDRHGLGHVKAEDLKQISGISTEVFRKVILPAVEKEVNEGKTFAKLRQIYQAMLLATWYKKKLKAAISNPLKSYVNNQKIKGLESDDSQAVQKIYKQYVSAFKKGAYDFIKEEYDPINQQIIPRKYFSGGVVLDNALIARGTNPGVQMKGHDLALLSWQMDSDTRDHAMFSAKSARDDLPAIRKSREKIIEYFENDSEFMEGYPKSGYHTWEHSKRTAEKIVVFAKALGITDEDLLNLCFIAGILHDNDPHMAPPSVVRTLALLDADFAKESGSFLKEIFGINSQEFLFIKAIIQRSEFPFIEGSQAYDNYKLILKDLEPEYKVAALQLAPVFSEFADKLSWYMTTENFSEFLDATRNLAGEYKWEIYKLETFAFFQKLRAADFSSDKKLSDVLGVTDIEYPLFDEMMARIDPRYALNFYRNFLSLKAMNFLKGKNIGGDTYQEKTDRMRDIGIEFSAGLTFVKVESFNTDYEVLNTEFNGDPETIRLRALIKTTEERLNGHSNLDGKITLGITGDRNGSMDEYIADYLKHNKSEGRSTVIDFGIGFPPITTVELAKKVVKTANVIGVDLNIPDYVVNFSKNETDMYSVFFEINYNQVTGQVEHRVIFVDAVEKIGTGFLHKTLDETESKMVKEKAIAIRDKLMRKHLGLDFYSKKDFTKEKDLIESEGNISFDPVRKEQTDNLTFVKSGFGLSGIKQKVNVIRVANVFDDYYTAQETADAIQRMGTMLNEGGILMAGHNTTFFVFKKTGDKMVFFEYVVGIELSYVRNGNEEMNIFDNPDKLLYQQFDTFPQYMDLMDSVENIVRIVGRNSHDLKEIYERYKDKSEFDAAEMLGAIVARIKILFRDEYELNFDGERYLHIKAREDTKGGIDFNPAALSMKVSQEGGGFVMPVYNLQNIDSAMLNMEAVAPVITNISPIKDLSQWVE
ncbi:MAG: HD domain-containing protein [Candidatus Omnitrophica bacterium]|nr:HD domain-containing protein [Candidatus Omnitrophota bacterium]